MVDYVLVCPTWLADIAAAGPLVSRLLFSLSLLSRASDDLARVQFFRDRSALVVKGADRHKQ